MDLALLHSPLNQLTRAFNPMSGWRNYIDGSREQSPQAWINFREAICEVVLFDPEDSQSAQEMKRHLVRTVTFPRVRMCILLNG
jgi:uncharacterized protein YecT (DUF1311 family)